MIASVGMHFGCNFCPPNFEPIARAKCDGTFKLHFRMYVDNGMSILPSDEPNRVNHLITASAESAYLLLGYPGPIQAPEMPATMSWDKMVNRPITITCKSLDITVDTNDMEVTIPNRRLTHLDELMACHWNKNRKQFTACAAAQLIRNILSCLQGCQWLMMAVFHMQKCLRQALKNNARHVARTSHFQALLAEKNKACLTTTTGRRMQRSYACRVNLLASSGIAKKNLDSLQGLP
jgi:hypothetical protein